MKNTLIAAGLASVIGLSAADATVMKVYDPYIGADFGLGSMSYVDLSTDESRYMPGSGLLMGFDMGAKFRTLDSIWNPGFSLGMNLTFPIEPEKWYGGQKPFFNFYTWGADFDNYFTIANRQDASARTDLIVGIGYHAVTTSHTGGGLGSGSTTDMSLAFKFGIDQALSDEIKLNAKMQIFALPGDQKGDQDMFFKMTIGFKMLF